MGGICGRPISEPPEHEFADPRTAAGGDVTPPPRSPSVSHRPSVTHRPKLSPGAERSEQ